MTYLSPHLSCSRLFSLLVGCCLTVSCSQEEVVNQSEASLSRSGEELFQALFLLNGPAASEIETYAKIQDKYEFSDKPEVLDELNRMGVSFIAAIKQKDPTFFDYFQRAIQSGDHFQVSKALDKGGEMLMYAIQQDELLKPYYDQGVELASTVDLEEVMDKQGGFDDVKLQALAEEYLGKANGREAEAFRMQACSIVGVCVVWVIVAAAQTVAAAVNYAAAVNVYAAAFVWTKAYGPSKEIENARQYDLRRSMLIQEITESFAIAA